MADHHDDLRVTALLAASARELAYPPTPSVAAHVLATLAAERRAPRDVGGPRLRGAALGAALALATVLALPGTRTAVAEFFGLVAGERIERDSATTVPSGAALRPDDFARPSTLSEAAAALGTAVPLPAGQAAPEGVFVVAYEGHQLVILQYAAFDLWVTSGEAFVIVKRIPADAILSVENVRGRPAYWIDSRAYDVRFFAADGREVSGARRTVDRHALIWRGAALYYRMETDLPLSQALAVAGTLP